jgi:hypothetical protein
MRCIKSAVENFIEPRLLKKGSGLVLGMVLGGTVTIQQTAALWDDPRRAHLDKWECEFNQPLQDPTLATSSRTRANHQRVGGPYSIVYQWNCSYSDRVLR